MRKTTFILFMLWLSGCAVLQAQPLAIYPFSLQQYTFNKKANGGLITSLILPQEKKYSVRLSGANASWLYVKGNGIYIQSKFLQKAIANKRIAFTVSLRENKKQVAQKPFLLLFNEFKNNRVIAHRGAWKQKGLPENSIASLKQAVALGCEGSEFDVHMTSDEVMVVNHDPEFMGMSIEKNTYADLLQKKMSNGETIPTLESYLKAGMQQSTTHLILEIKASVISDERTLALTEKIVSLVHRLQAQAWVNYISFDYDALKKVLSLDPAAKTSYLKGEKTPEQLKQDGMYGSDYHYSVYQQHPGWIEATQQLGLTINSWTVNDSITMKWLLAHNADFITTNEPEMLFRQLKENPALDKRKLVWFDEFNYKGLPDSSKWSYEVGGNGWGNNEKQYYTKDDTANAVVKNGSLFITVRKDTTRNYTSARLVTKNKGDWKDGRIEVRAKLPKGRGLWPAIWMLSTDWQYGGWPASGEIDIMEHVGYMPDSIFTSVHTKTFNHVIHTQKTKGFFVDEPYDKFHVYAIDWTKDEIKFYMDDIQQFSFQNTGKGFAEWPFDKRFHLLLNVAVGGNWGGKEGIDETVFPASMEVDYVRVFQ